MTDSIIIVILVIVLFLASRAVLKKSREKSSCCSGGTYKAKPRKLDTISCRKVFTVEGMSCQHCVNRVMEAINSIDGYSAVVDLRKGTATVSSEGELNEARIRSAIEKAGYTVTSIQ